MKKLLLSLFILFVLFNVTGCGITDENGDNVLKRAHLVDLKYDLPKGYSKIESFDLSADDKTVSYTYAEDENKSINLYYLKGKDYSYLEEDDTKYTEETVNGTTWRIINDSDFGINYREYYTVYEGALYHIELNEIDKYYKEYEEFIKTLSFY